MWTTIIKMTLVLILAFIGGVMYDEYFKNK